MPSEILHVPLTEDFLLRMLSWAEGYKYFIYYNPNDHHNDFGCFKHQLVVSNTTVLHSNEGSFDKLQKHIEGNSTNLYGFFSYELKDEHHPLVKKEATIPSPHALFFAAEIVIEFFDGEIRITGTSPNEIWQEIQQQGLKEPPTHTPNIEIKSRTTKNEYIRNCQKIKQDIVEGEYYEMNYCIEYYSENSAIDPIHTYIQLNQMSPMPFSCLGKFDHLYTLCASPERFIKKKGQKLISQPIKGTIRRGKDISEDQQLKTILRNSQKEIAENMMIVDLVRNDLNKSSITGSVKVEEFFGIYTFKQVHQMISTVTSQARKNIPLTDIIKNAYPMGSMTGAPKIRVMQAIDHYEKSRRGIYSGSIGYITNEGDFDFNVVIRSIIYDVKSSRLSFHVGSAITYDADPEYEYEECLLKAKSMMEILSQE